MHRAHAWCAWCGAHGTRTSLSSRSPIALDWSVRKAAAPLSLSVLSLIASVSPVRKAPHRLSRRKRGAEAADTSSPFAAIALTEPIRGAGGVKEADTRLKTCTRASLVA